MLDTAVCEKARLSKDARFDGKFFTAVITTGIFCRPICPARAPKPENVRYYPTAELAQNSGFKPCKRCFPELAAAPQLPHKIKTISQSYYRNNQSISECAKQLNISDRQLRRLFVQHYQLPPSEFFHQQRLLQARKLLTTTALSMTNVAYAAGFKSVRRFNEVILAAYQVPPSELRKKFKENKKATNSDSIASNTVTLELPYRPPFDWPLMLSFFRLRQIENIEQVDEHSYSRGFKLDNCRGWFNVSQKHYKHNSKERPLTKQHSLTLTVHLSDFTYLNVIISKVRRMFDLDADMTLIHQHLKKEPKLASVIEAFPGLRLPGCWDIFEFSIRAILGQQISVKAATTMAQRIAEKYGQVLSNKEYDESTPGFDRIFPTPEQLANVDYAGIGLTKTRIATLQRWVNYFILYPNVLEQYQDLAQLEKQLGEIKGIGPWTINYIAMRGLSDPDAFPSADLGIIKALDQDKNELSLIKKNREILAQAEQWRPWRAYSAIFLWQSLAHKDPVET